MNVLLFYFSGTGNTRWASEKLCAVLSGDGVLARCVSIEDAAEDLAADVLAADMVGFAFPVYAANLPPVMRSFLGRLGREVPRCGGKKPYFVVTTAGYSDGCGPYEVKKALKRRDFRLVGYAGVRIASNTPKTKRLSDEEMAERLSTAEKALTRLAGRLRAGKKSVPFGPYRIGFFRKAAVSALKTAHTRFSVDGSRCDGCGRCGELCPTKSIVRDGGAWKFLPSCTSCMRCYNSCPQDAILFNGEFLPHGQYARYRGPDPKQVF
jgi:MinD superfamily P-loop ATPase containing an inserted ferredoxin domain